MYPPNVQGGSHRYQAAKGRVSACWRKQLSYSTSESASIDQQVSSVRGRSSWTSSLICYGILERCARRLRYEGWSGYFNFVPVESNADDVCSRVLSSQEESTSDVGAPLITIVHNCNEEAFTVAQLGSHLEKECGGDGRGFDGLGMEEWIEKAGKLGLGQMVGMYLAEVMEKRQGNYPEVVHMRE